MKKPKQKNISKKKTYKKPASKKPEEKKPLTAKQIERIEKKIDFQKREVVLQKKVTTNKTRGKFGGQLTNLLVKSFTFKYPDISKKDFSKSLGVSQQTLNKIIAGKKTRLQTLKKVAENMNSFLDSKKQIEITLIAEHLKKYKGISKKKLEEIQKRVKQVGKNIENLKNKEYIFFKIHYAKNKLNNLQEGLK